MKTQEFLNNLTHDQKVELAFQLMDYISTEMTMSGDKITIITSEYLAESEVWFIFDKTK